MILGEKIPQRTFKTRVFRLEYNFNTTTIRLGVCKTTAQRGKNGFVNCIAYYNKMNDIWVQAKFFYRGTSGTYQLFIVNLDFDACDPSRYISENILLLRALTVFDKFDPSFRKGCPFVGPFYSTNFHFDDEAAWLFPPIMPGI